jgi:hypothetical protein
MGTVRLTAARNETVWFQIILKGKAKSIKARAAFDQRSPVKPEILRFRHIQSETGLLPDPLQPVTGALSLPADDETIRGQTANSLVVECHVPKTARATDHNGNVTLEIDGETFRLPILLTVWKFTLPDHLSFVPQMNCYGLPDDLTLSREYYREAHRHRTCLNRLPYSWTGRIDTHCGPRINGDKWDWSDYDERFAPLLDGSAFSDLPRGAVPVEAFYIPINENWPMSIDDGFTGGYWIEDAITDDYWKQFDDACRRFAQHIAGKNWNETSFEFYLNNKVYFKKDDWRKCSAPWIFDEPVNTQDFWALREYGVRFHKAISGRTGKAWFAYRGDISRPEWQRDLLDNVLDINICGGNFRKYHRLVMDRKRADKVVTYNYGSSNDIEKANTQPAAWAVDTWCLGGDGIVPWQTVGKKESWEKADKLSLFYPPRFGSKGPIPSVRLKGYTRGQQDTEYLTLLSRQLNLPRHVIGDAARKALKLEASLKKTHADDAGLVEYKSLTAQQLWQLRTAIGAYLNEKEPKPLTKLVNLRTPQRDMSKTPDLGYARVAPPRPKRQPNTATAAAPSGRKVVIQGKGKVHDALIRYDQPDKRHGGERRNNRLERQDRCNAMLFRFDTSALRGKTINKAELVFRVWDPSSNAPTRVNAYTLPVSWDEGSVTWKERKAGTPWEGGAFKTDGKRLGTVIVQPDQDKDTADPPIAYRLEVTAAARDWAAGKANNGVAIMPQVDRAVDDGHYGRMQIIATEFGNKYTPSLEMWVE